MGAGLDIHGLVLLREADGYAEARMRDVASVRFGSWLVSHSQRQHGLAIETSGGGVVRIPMPSRESAEAAAEALRRALQLAEEDA